MRFWGLLYGRGSLIPFKWTTKIISKDAFRTLRTSIGCKVEFNQPFVWLYSVPNLFVFQQLVTLYLGGIIIRVVSEIL